MVSVDRFRRPWRGAPAALVVLILAPGVPASAQPPTPLDGPLSPERAPGSFRVEPSLRVELVAAEPLVVSPVAVAFDERGRLFVAENRGYPTGPGEGKPPVGRIARLEDTDGDGRMDRRTEFAAGLTYPNGLMPWNGGLVVTCAPEVLWLRDTDGDGKADERRVLFTGFATGGSTQLRVSHPTLSIDNWVYLTSGLTGGKVTCPDHPDRPPVVLGRTDFRFRPDRSDYGAADGGAQFGQTFDDFGRRFICYNRVQVQHVVIESRVLRRNPHLAFSDTVQNCPAEMVAEPLKGHGAAARLFPLSRNVTTADSHAGTFTAACAVTVYRGTGLPDRYRGAAFSCDPTGNLVHVDRLDPNGATFAARRMSPGVEFLASTDNWFRPVFLAHGPDGALYVCDMYRKTIEHPDYLPVEVRKRTDFEGGKTMGRLWRVVGDDARPEDLRRLRQVGLADATTPELCEALRDRDGWHRDTAHRLILERKDPSAAEHLNRLARDPKASPAAVVHALRLLDALGALDRELVRRALRHPAAPVREHAVMLAEGRPPLADEAAGRANDPDARVRFQVAVVLGTLPPPASAGGDSFMRALERSVTDALTRIAIRDGADRWSRAAVFSALAGREASFLAALCAAAGDSNALPPDLPLELGRLLAPAVPVAKWPGVMRQVVRERPGFAPADQAALLTGFADAARGRLAPDKAGDPLAALAGDDRALAADLDALVGAMSRTALNPSAPADRRRAAVGLLVFAGFDRSGSPLLKLIDATEPDALRVAAVRALGAQRDGRVAPALLDRERFPSYAPALREEVLSALLSQTSHAPGLLAAVEDGRVPPVAIDALRRRQLTAHPDPAIRARAGKLFGAVAGDRAKVYESYKDVVGLKADPVRGRAVFRRECAQCHRLDQEGSAVGPDLFGIRNQPKEAILLHVLVPDHEITEGFAAYTVATRDGRVLTGLIASETPASITLRQALGKDDTILRDQIEQLSAGKQSLMPSGVEKTVTRQEFADLLAYLKGEGPPLP